jgi:hypothetical protein
MSFGACGSGLKRILDLLLETEANSGLQCL